VLVASALEPDATTFPVRASFVPWLADVLAQRLGGGASAGQVVHAAPGARVTPPPGVDSLAGLDGRRVAAAAAGLSAPAQPGVYFWLRKGARAGALEVNPEAEESRLARLSEQALRAQVRSGAAQVTVVQQRDALAAAAWRGEGRRPVGGPLLAVALVALAAEGLATRRVGRARR
jgi:hypothetical protein